MCPKTRDRGNKGPVNCTVYEWEGLGVKWVEISPLLRTRDTLSPSPLEYMYLYEQITFRRVLQSVNKQ